MNQLARQWLSMMLILLLGLSPLQFVLAEQPVPVDRFNLPCHMSATDSVDMISPMQSSNNDCDKCATTSDCDNSCFQCTTNGLALLQSFTALHNHSPVIIITQLDEKTTSLQPPALFRPPRV